jgi:alcohol dehydrogenase (NADP+)
LSDPTVTRLAKKHGKTTAQVLLRHIMQHGIAVIPKSANPDRIVQNCNVSLIFTKLLGRKHFWNNVFSDFFHMGQVFDFELSEADMKELNALDKGAEGRLFAASIKG